MSNDFKEINVCVTGIQHQVGSAFPDPPVITKTKGTFREKDGVSYIKYSETYDDEGNSSDCLLKVYDNKLELAKKGVVKTKMSFIPGENAAASYELPFGTVDLSVKTHKFCVSREKSRLTVHASYELFMEGNKTSDCTINIEIDGV